MIEKSSQKRPLISIISAIGKSNRVIGTNDGKIPWHISEDFKYFKEKTFGHPIIMGRKTFETFKNPLPGRVHIVISRQEKNSLNSDLIFVKSLDEAITKAKQIEQEEIFIIGGGQIYEIALHLADRLYLTFVEGDFVGEVYFPDFESAGFNKIISSRKSCDGNCEYEFVVLER